MKKLLLLSLVSLCLSGCGIAQTKQLPVYIVNATVTEIFGDRALISQGQYSNFNIPTQLPVEHIVLEKGKGYTFYLEIVGEKIGYTKKAVVVGITSTCAQTQKDQENTSKSLSKRTIIRKTS